LTQAVQSYISVELMKYSGGVSSRLVYLIEMSTGSIKPVNLCQQF